MLNAYDLSTEQSVRNATYEISQQIILSGLSQGGFFDIAALYGGTCLRVFHGLDRYSEDMDFTLLSPDASFSFTKYFQPIVDEFAYIGRNVEIRRKSKSQQSRVESAFLKDTTDIYDISFQTNRSIKIKIEVDVMPPLAFSTEYKLLLQPRSSMVRCLVLPDLFAGKLHALVYRGWKRRVKGRDWYDFEWYVRHNVPVNYAHLHERIREFNGKDVSKEDFQALLKERLSTTDIRTVKADVLPFVRKPHDLDIWTNDYFLHLASMMRFQ